ncbi:MAG: segregation and condensation protein A [Candidatus Kryptoniota bacterium]
MNYRVKLNDFEGPLDLLLFFIRRDQLDIYDIPIAQITAEFLEYVRFIQALDLEIAGEFIVMAATLMHIKVRMLLPHEETVDDLLPDDDPRKELADRLAEYARFKEAANNFQRLEEDASQVFYRSNFKLDERSYALPEDEQLMNVSLIDLITAFKNVMERLEPTSYHDVKRINVTIEDQIDYLTQTMRERKEMHFLELVQQIHDKIRLVVTFIAMLELIKRNMLKVYTTGKFNDFIISKYDGENDGNVSRTAE